MASLYEILGLNKNATAEQIEQGFVTQSDVVSNTEPDPDKRRVRQKVIREAYDILSSPTRRQAYDQRQQFGARSSHELVESFEFPWLKVLVVVAILLGANLIYQNKLANEARREALITEAKLAKVEAQRAAREAEAEQARLLRLAVMDKQEAENRRTREMEQARRDGREIHNRLEQAAERDRYQILAEKDRERSRRQQAEYERMREEQNAKQRVIDQQNAMRRALALRVRTPD